jgi:large conductance mechanosensitive channel
MSVISEFKEFAMRGNVIDLAVGVVIGAAFGKIVSGFVENIIMPPIGLLLGGVSFDELKWVLKPAESEEVAEVAISYGVFVSSLLDFIIIAFAIFMAVRAINNLKKPEPEVTKEKTGPSQEELLTEIRDLLKKG